MPNICEITKEIVSDIISELGYELVDVTYKKEYGENNLTLYIYKKGGVGLDDCEEISEAVGGILDDSDITSGAAYNLNVSSPGLDRPIVTVDDFRRNLDEDIELFFLVPVGKKKKVHGILKEYNDESIVLNCKDKEFVFDIKNCSKIVPYINFK